MWKDFVEAREESLQTDTALKRLALSEIELSSCIFKAFFYRKSCTWDKLYINV